MRSAKGLAGAATIKTIGLFVTVLVAGMAGVAAILRDIEQR